MKLAIVGSRYMQDEDFFTNIVNNWIDKHGKPELIISGGANGADALAKKYAKNNSIVFNEYIPDWNTYGKSAGPIRNIEIINNATHCIAFPSKFEKGTQDSINKCKKKNVPVEIYYID